MSLLNIFNSNVAKLASNGDIDRLLKSLAKACESETKREKAKKDMIDAGNSVIDSLILCLEYPSSLTVVEIGKVRRLVIETLCSIGNDRTVEFLINTILDKTKDRFLKSDAVYALSKGKKNDRMIEAFALALRDKSKVVRSAARNALKNWNWKPSNDIDRALFILLEFNPWDVNPELAIIGQPVVEAIRITNNFEWDHNEKIHEYEDFNKQLIRTIEFLRKEGLALDDTPEEIIAGARPYLCQSNSPEYDRKIADGLINTPKETIRAIRNRGWSGRGHEDEALNDFLVRLLGRIFSEFENKEIRSDVIETLIEIFEEPDDRTSGRTGLIELAIEILAERKIREARKRLNEIKIGENMSTINTINYVLSKEW